MIYWELFIGFLRVGCFAFGGAYAAIPLIREVVLDYGWIDDTALSYMIAVSESTPGPVMVNMATYVGASQGGVLGSAIATFAVVLPAFLIILLIMVVLKSILKNAYVQAVLDGLKSCVIGIIVSTGAYMLLKTCTPIGGGTMDIRDLIMAGLIGAVLFGTKKLLKKNLSPIKLICISAVLGMVVYSV